MLIFPRHKSQSLLSGSEVSSEEKHTTSARGVKSAPGPRAPWPMSTLTEKVKLEPTPLWPLHGRRRSGWRHTAELTGVEMPLPRRKSGFYNCRVGDK